MVFLGCDYKRDASPSIEVCLIFCFLYTPNVFPSKIIVKIYTISLQRISQVTR